MLCRVLCSRLHYNHSVVTFWSNHCYLTPERDLNIHTTFQKEPRYPLLYIFFLSLQIHTLIQNYAPKFCLNFQAWVNTTQRARGFIASPFVVSGISSIAKLRVSSSDLSCMHRVHQMDGLFITAYILHKYGKGNK